MKNKNPHLQALIDFHTKYLSHVGDHPSLQIPEATKELRPQFISEESTELLEALRDNKDLRHIAKELADLYYVVLGTAVVYGLQEYFDDVFTEVHRSNMSKDVVFHGKAVKGSNYSPADLSFIPIEEE